uniref:Hopsarin-D n=1 Tax=Lygus hesperus TaxID=30085 RepID=A0A0A9YWW3_LYGHE
MNNSRKLTVTLFCAIVILKTILVESEFPDARDATSNLAEVKCVGLVINKGTSSKCQGTFLTQQHLATSCRCIGETDKTTGVYTQGSPGSYEVKSWSKGVAEETQAVDKLYFYYNCGIEPNKVLMDLGLVRTAGPFSERAVVPAVLPDAELFRFYEYIYRLQILQTRCMSTSLEKPAGSVLNMTLKNTFDCPRKATCLGTNRTDCELITLQTNHICAVPTPTVTPTTPAPANDTKPTVPPPNVYQPCQASGGAPLLCHKLLVAVNGRSADCNDPYNSYMFVRIDYTMNWLMSLIC